jgi:hypothetical protein
MRTDLPSTESTEPHPERLLWRTAIGFAAATLLMFPLAMMRGALAIVAGLLFAAWAALCLFNYRGFFDQWAARARNRRYADFFGNRAATRAQCALAIVIGLGWTAFGIQSLVAG